MFMVLPPWQCHCYRVPPLDLMNTEQRQVAADLWTKPACLDHKPACRL